MESKRFSKKKDEERDYDLEELAWLLPTEKLRLVQQMLKPSRGIVRNALGKPLAPVSRKVRIQGAKEVLQHAQQDLTDLLRMLERL